MKKVLTLALALCLGMLVSVSSAAASGKIRVLVMDNLPGVTLDFPPEFNVKGLSGIGETEPDGHGGVRMTLSGNNCPVGGLRINTDGVVINAEKYALTGVIEIKKNPGGLFRIINELGLEDYTRAVVGEEMGADWPLEALKAQAVLARTYAMYRKQNRCGRSTGFEKDYDLCATVKSQMFDGDAVEKEGPALAARETRGEILTYDGAPIEAVYHSTCGGRTEDAYDVWGRKYPYLVSIKCRYCADSPYRRWKKQIKISVLYSSLRRAGYMIDGLKAIQVLERSRSKRIKTLRIIGDSGSVAMKGTDFRKAVGYSEIPSTAFEAHKDGDSFVFIGKGSGHGVGLCQYGARGMALAGKNYREILRYYYPGTTLTKLSEEPK